MLYTNIILTLFVLLVVLILIASMPNKVEIDKVKAEQKEFNEYQKEINQKVLELHEEMLNELRILNYRKED